jgi:phage-related protein
MTVALKPLKFVGGSKKDLSAFPAAVKQDIGHSLFIAQQGGRTVNAKIMRGFSGGSVIELVEDFDGDAYRCVYTARMQDAIVVLHAFQKKSKRGAETPKHEVELIRARLRDALAGDWR